MVDTQLETWSSRPLSDANSIVSNVKCYSTCTSCNGPSDESCLDYYKLNIGVVTSTGGQFALTQDQLLAQRSPSDNSIFTSALTMEHMAFTGWYYEDPLAADNNLFRVKDANNAGYSIDRSLLGISLSYNGGTPVSLTTSAPPAQKWYFVAMSLDTNQLHLCVWAHLSSPANCQNAPFTAPSLTLPLTFSIGTAAKPAITGKMTDQRFYPGSSNELSETEIINIFTKDSIPLRCITALSLFECSVCESGYFSPPTCISKVHTECTNGCSECYDKPWKCSACTAPLQLTEDHLCLSACPTGSTLSSGKCTNPSALLFDFTLDQVSPKIKDSLGNEAINGAKEANYYPSSVEGTDPRPSSYRGYHFNTGQYMWIANAYMVAPTMTFTAWVRPFGGQHFLCYYSQEFWIWVISGTMLNVSPNFQNTSAQSDAILTEKWAFVTIICSYKDTTGTSDVSFYVDGVLKSTKVDNKFYIRDSLSSNKGYIGISGTAFAYKITLRNGIWTAFSTAIESSGRPLGLGYSLSNAPFTHTQQGDMCLPECVDGCSRPVDCNLCLDPLCLDCPNLQESRCVTCRNHSTWIDGQCKCDMSYFHDIRSASCKPCWPFCKNCEGQGANQCTECFEYAEAINGVCECSSSAYPSPDKAHCAPCSSTCLSCGGEGPLQCLACRAGAYMKSAAPSECICNSNFFPDPDPGICTPCTADCLLCLNGNTCSKCYPNAMIAEGRCKCLEGYYGNPNETNCLPCESGCLQCSMEACFKCSPLLFILGGVCVSECPFGYKSDSFMICQQVENPPIPTLSVTTNNTLSVTFDKPMNCYVGSSDISITAQIPGNLETGIKWSDPFFHNTSILIIILLFEATYLPSNSSLTLTFLTPNLVVDTQGISIRIFTLSGPLTPFGSAPPLPSPSLLSTSFAQQTSAASNGAVFSSVAISIVSGNSAGLISLVNQLQMISYISMTKLEIEEDFASSLAALNVGGMIPNPVSDRYSMEGDEMKPPAHVVNYGIKTSLFLSNSVTFLGTSAAILLAYLPIYLLSKVKVKLIAKYFKSKLQGLKWNVPLQLWLTSYLDMSIFSLLQLRNAAQSLSSWISVASLVVASIFAICAAVTPIVLIAFFMRKWSLIIGRSDEEFNRKWGALFLSFKADRQSAGFAYYVLFTVRRFILAITLVLLPDQLILLAAVNTTLSFLVTPTQTCMYLLICRPFTSRLDLSEAAIIEVCTFGIYSLASSFLFELSSSTRELIGSIGAWAVIAAVGMNSGISLVRTVLMVVGLIKAKEARIKIAQRNLSELS